MRARELRPRCPCRGLDTDLERAAGHRHATYRAVSPGRRRRQAPGRCSALSAQDHVYKYILSPRVRHGRNTYSRLRHHRRRKDSLRDLMPYPTPPRSLFLGWYLGAYPLDSRCLPLKKVFLCIDLLSLSVTRSRPGLLISHKRYDGYRKRRHQGATCLFRTSPTEKHIHAQRLVNCSRYSRNS